MYAAAGPLQVARTMTVIRTGGAVTVVNAVRLGAAGEAALAAIGPVVRVVRLGAFHGVDDEYYRRVHGAALWAAAGTRLARGAAAADGVLVDAAPATAAKGGGTGAGGDRDGGGDAGVAAAPPAMPLRGAGVAVLPTPYPEVLLYVPHLGPPGGLLLAADAVVHVPAGVRPPHVNALSAALTRWAIASATALRVPPLWARAQAEGGVVPATLRAAYARTGGWPAEGFITAHGEALLPPGGTPAVRAAVAEAAAAALPPETAE